MPLDTQSDLAAGVNALRSFARVNGIPEDMAVEVYQRELRLVRLGARVERFVTVIAEKHAKDALRSQGGSGRGDKIADAPGLGAAGR